MAMRPHQGRGYNRRVSGRNGHESLQLAYKIPV